jgi:hypothetical protein
MMNARPSRSSSCHGDRHERRPEWRTFDRVIDALPGLVWTVLPDPHIDFLNPALVRIFLRVFMLILSVLATLRVDSPA